MTLGSLQATSIAKKMIVMADLCETVLCDMLSLKEQLVLGRKGRSGKVFPDFQVS